MFAVSRHRVINAVLRVVDMVVGLWPVSSVAGVYI